jgi:hypothetical protein
VPGKRLLKELRQKTGPMSIIVQCSERLWNKASLQRDYFHFKEACFTSKLREGFRFYAHFARRDIIANPANMKQKATS